MNANRELGSEQDLRQDLRQDLALCERETEVIAAVEQDAWSDELARHAAECSACADTRKVAELFAFEGERALEEADLALASPQRLPAADQIYRRARGEERRAAVERALQPIRWVERLSVAVGALVVALGGGWLASAVKPLFAPWWSSFTHTAGKVTQDLVTAASSMPGAATGAAGTAGAGSPGVALALLWALALGGLALALYGSWSRQT